VVLGMGLILLATVLTTGCIGFYAPGGDLGDGELEDMPTITFTPGKLVVKFHDNVTLENATKMVEDLNSTTPEEIWVDDDDRYERSRWLVIEVPKGAEEHYVDLFELQEQVEWGEQY